MYAYLKHITILLPGLNQLSQCTLWATLDSKDDCTISPHYPFVLAFTAQKAATLPVNSSEHPARVTYGNLRYPAFE